MALGITVLVAASLYAVAIGDRVIGVVVESVLAVVSADLTDVPTCVVLCSAVVAICAIVV